MVVVVVVAAVVVAVVVTVVDRTARALYIHIFEPLVLKSTWAVGNNKLPVN